MSPVRLDRARGDLAARRTEQRDERGWPTTMADGLVGVWVIIPALNEAEALPKVLAALPPVEQVIVVDNGSTDLTAEVARRCGATVVYEPQRGYGAACLCGLAEIRRQVTAQERVPPAIVAFLDGDYSDYPQLLPVLTAPIARGAADFVLGSRLWGTRERGAMPPQSVWGNRFACWLMRCVWGADYTDLGPFRAISYASLQYLAMEDKGYGWTVEMQVKAYLAGLRIQETPLPYRRRVGVSKISGTVIGSVKAGCKILSVIARFVWKMPLARRSPRRA